MKNTIIFIIFVLAVLGLLYAVSGTRSPRIPDNESHRGIDTVVACLECHGQGKQFARKPTHPPKDECFICHKVKRTTKTK